MNENKYGINREYQNNSNFGDPVARQLDCLQVTRIAKGTAYGYRLRVITSPRMDEEGRSWDVELKMYFDESLSRCGTYHYRSPFEAHAIFEKLVNEYNLEEKSFEGGFTNE